MYQAISLGEEAFKDQKLEIYEIKYFPYLMTHASNKHAHFHSALSNPKLKEKRWPSIYTLRIDLMRT